MNKKTAIGIINIHNQEIFLNLKNSLPAVDYVIDVHNTTSNINFNNQYKKYISYGGLFNCLLRQCLVLDVDYIFLLTSNIIINDNTVFNDYINTAKTFGTWFMSKGSKEDKYISVEDDSKNVTLNLFENLNLNLIFMLKSHIKHCGFFNEGFTNIDSYKEDANCLEIYDYYNKIENKFKYLPKGYFPDTEHSLTKLSLSSTTPSRPNLKPNTTNNITNIYGKFYYHNKFIPGKHKLAKQEDAVSILEKIQKTYATFSVN